MKKRFPGFSCFALVLGSWLTIPAHAQYVPVVPLIGVGRMIAAQSAANKAFIERTTTTETYRGKDFLVQRTPEDLLVGDATDRIAQVEAQLARCYAALRTDSTGRVCSPEQQATIQAALSYLGLNRSSWSQKAYRQELKFYLAEDKRRQAAAR